METKFNFNSQVCTDRNQSERLLALGLKPETADCTLIPSCDNDGTDIPKIGNLYLELRDGAIPAWSLNRLIEMRLAHDQFAVFQLFQKEDAFEKVISHIEHAIKEGYFNKEYLV